MVELREPPAGTLGILQNKNHGLLDFKEHFLSIESEKDADLLIDLSTDKKHQISGPFHQSLWNQKWTQNIGVEVSGTGLIHLVQVDWSKLID